ncbi:hypothetical protein GYMLUDRAFT_249755 [Collybiopsis luxurians FD-317 M1]|uniref:Uncharacterized protein n=1 Tax=Collybiopsis luxurians FD-317 M1 TaxID=944289 RepID=A0A0D0BHA7_9AGAR|nr:hypothetical protein GYMLUDRAFT_249755 [Collybiopsis luxurians FD-317 M1]
MSAVSEGNQRAQSGTNPPENISDLAQYAANFLFAAAATDPAPGTPYRSEVMPLIPDNLPAASTGDEEEQAVRQLLERIRESPTGYDINRETPERRALWKECILRLLRLEVLELTLWQSHYLHFPLLVAESMRIREHNEKYA